MAKGQIKQKQATIKKEQFESLCAIQCTQEEICHVLNVSDKTLTEWCKSTYGKYFSEIFQEKRSLGKSSLRRSQWRLAEHNATMAIWLGKQYLGQREVPDVDTKELQKVEQLLSALTKEANNDIK